MRFDFSKEESVFSLAASMPPGLLWEGSFDDSTNLGRLIKVLAVEYYRLSLLAQKLSDEMDIRKTSDLLIEWEKSVGIPNEYFDTSQTIERRRQQIEQLFSNFGGVQINGDFVRVATFFGFEITVIAGSDYAGTPELFPLEFPLTFSQDIRTVTHTIYVHIVSPGSEGIFFPLDFPLEFSTGGQNFMRLIFEILIPANVQLIFI